MMIVVMMKGMFDDNYVLVPADNDDHDDRCGDADGCY